MCMLKPQESEAVRIRCCICCSSHHLSGCCCIREVIVLWVHVLRRARRLAEFTRVQQQHKESRSFGTPIGSTAAATAAAAAAASRLWQQLQVLLLQQHCTSASLVFAASAQSFVKKRK